MTGIADFVSLTSAIYLPSSQMIHAQYCPSPKTIYKPPTVSLAVLPIHYTTNPSKSPRLQRKIWNQKAIHCSACLRERSLEL